MTDDAKLLALATKIREIKDSLTQLKQGQETITKLEGPQGPKGEKGDPGLPGKDGKDGKDGVNGKDGKDGDNGKDGISVVDAKIHFDGSLVLTLSDGTEIDCGKATNEEVSQAFYALKQTRGSAFDQIDFNITTDIESAPGRMTWNDTDGTLNLGLKGGNVVLQMGQELVYRVRNNSGVDIPNGAVVQINGSTGFRPVVQMTQATMGTSATVVIGVATEDIAKNTDGYINTFGLVRNIDTSALTEGAAVWLSDTVLGGMTSTQPDAPAHLVLIGYCVRSHPTLGSVFVKIQNSYDLDELNDVDIVSPANGHVLTYDSTSGLWVNAAPAGGGGAGVTSVGLAAPTGFTVSASPVTSTGTLSIAFDTGYSLPTNSKQTNWDTAHGWGNHATAGYLTTETDPVFSASAASGISSTNISNWNTAFGWGNHASAGYLTTSTAASTYQPLDGDLTAIAGLAGTSGLLKKTAANTWTLDTSSHLTSTDIGSTVQGYSSNLASWSALAPSSKQDTLVSATNIKTINGSSILGSGNLVVTGAAPTIAVLTSTQQSTATALADVTQLVAALDANSTYEVDCFVTFQSAATTAGLNLGFTSPTSSTCMLEVVVPIVSTAAASALRVTFPNTTSTNTGNVLGTGVTAINSNHTARMSGIVRTGANAGNFQVRFATEVASSAITLQIGSTLVVNKLA